MSLVLVTAPTEEPLTVEEAKLHLRLDPDASDDDALIMTLIQAAREHFEAKTNRALIEQTWRVTYDRFPCEDFLDLGMADVRSIASFTYIDSTGVSTDVPTGYTLDADHCPSRILRAYGSNWPTARAQRNAVRATFVTGIASQPGEVPAQIQAGLKLLIGTWYENREAFVESRFALEVPFSVDALFARYRRFAAEMA